MHSFVPPPPLLPTKPHRLRHQQLSSSVRARSDERKLHPLNIFHVNPHRWKTKTSTSEPNDSPPLPQAGGTATAVTDPQPQRPIVAPTPRDSKLQSPRLRKFTEEQLEILDRQVNRIIKQKSLEIYQTLVARFYPTNIENRVLTHDAAAHRVHAAFRYAVKEYIDVRAIREKVLVQLEGIVHQNGSGHDGFGFLSHLGQRKTTPATDTPKPMSLKEKIQAKKKEIHAQKIQSDQDARADKWKKVRGIKFWQQVVRQKYWKALMPKVERMKPWEQIKHVKFPERNIDIRSWKEKRTQRRNQWSDTKNEWMYAQFNALRKPDMEDSREMAGTDGAGNVVGVVEAIVEDANTHTIAALHSPTVVAFHEKLQEHTKRKNNIPSPLVGAVPSKRYDTWEDIVTLLQDQHILRPDFHRLWDNDLKQWPIRRPFRPVQPPPPSVAAKPNTSKGQQEEEKATANKEWPDRLGRYLLPNYNLVNPASKGTLEDYYASLGKNAPEKALVGVGVEKSQQVILVVPPWFRVRAAVSDLVDERSPLRTNWFRCQMSAVPSRSSNHMPRLGGVYSASPTSALPCSSFAPHAWNHSSSTKDSREKWKREHGQIDANAKEKETITPGEHTTATASVRQETPQIPHRPDTKRHAPATRLQQEMTTLVERDESKTMRWTTFLPEGASVMPKNNSTVDHDLVIRNLICKTIYLNLHSVEHQEKKKLLDVRTGGNDETVRCAVIASNPLVSMHREGSSTPGNNNSTHEYSGTKNNNNSSSTAIVPMRIPPFPYRVVHRLLKHLKEYVGMGPERLKVTFCPLELMRVLSAVVRAASKYHQKVQAAKKNGSLSKAAGAEILGGRGGNTRNGRGLGGLTAKGRRKLTKRRTAMILVVKDKVSPPRPLDYTVADKLIWSTEMLHYPAKDRLSLIMKYTSPTFRKVSDVAATYWKEAAVNIDRLEGLAYEISCRAGSAGKVGSVSRYHAVESKVMARWNVLTLLNEFDMTYNTVAGVLAILFVRFHDVVAWSNECYVERMTKARTIMRRELTPSMAGTF
jgi:hypothetical protein